MDFLATPFRRRILFSALYLSEGAPIGFVWWALPTLLRVAEVPLTRITLLTSLLVLPWSFKFLWAPLVDVFQSSHWGLRHWILASQTAMCLTLAPLFWLDLSTDFLVLACVLLLHAVAAATQDVAIDAWCIQSTTRAERGGINGWMQAAMLVGRAIMGGGALILDTYLGHTAIIAILIVLTACSMLLVAQSSEHATASTEAERPPRLWRALRADLSHVLRDRNTWWGLLFAGTAGAAYEGVGSVAGPFLIDLGLEQEQVGWFFALPTVVCVVAGALAGGTVADGIGPRRTILLAQAVILAAILSLAATTIYLPDSAGRLALAWLAIMYVGIGLFTSSSYAFLMNATRPSSAATQFSAFMGATNGCEAWSALAIGQLVARLGYPLAFAGMALVSLLALVTLRFFEVDEPPLAP